MEKKSTHRVAIAVFWRTFHHDGKVIFYFLHNKAAKKLKTIGAYTESTDLIFKTFKKIIHLVTQSI
jgi:hypothetical protein